MNNKCNTFFVSLFVAILLAPSAFSADKLTFNRDVRPILSDNCYRCHGNDKANRKGKLRLDEREIAVAKKAIVPGNPGESELIKRINSTDEEEHMPPAITHKTLTPAQKETLKRWITEGAEYEPHWAYIAPQRPTVPAVTNKEWVQNPLDAFVLHTLESLKIQPSREAERNTLLRRLTLDLIGLPPTPEEISAFKADTDPKAYERAVDRLLASPHYGERMAVPWLDAVRFADTVGFHGDQNQNIFPYRDYVINAFNSNKPFDQFTREQLAGDMLPMGSPEAHVATGFNRLNMVTREGGAQPKEYLSKYQADRVRTVSTAWLGSTMTCCECHDHKFDPFSIRDFYSMEAFFADVKQWGVYQDYGYTPNPDLKGFTNEHPFPPEIEVESPYLKQRIAKLRDRMAEIASAAGTKLDSDAAYSKWRESIAAFLKTSPSGWATPRVEINADPAPAAAKKTPAKKDEKPAEAPSKPELALQTDGSVLISRKSGSTVELKMELSAGWLSAIQLELLPDSANGGSILLNGAKSGQIKFSAALHKKSDPKEQPISFRFAEVNFREHTYKNGYAVIGIKDSWKVAAGHLNEPNVALWIPTLPIQSAAGDVLNITLASNIAGRVRISVSPLVPYDVPSPEFNAALLKALSSGNETAETKAQYRAAYLRGTAWDTASFDKVKALEPAIQECRHGRSMTLVTEVMPPLVTRVLPRGNWQDESGEILTPAVPHFLPQIPNPENRRLSRLDLAKWLTSPENPLTARVFVNRLWKQLFGNGLSAFVDDLGSQGEWPVHPELLDWLAVEFRESGWDMKRMVKLMVMSSAYRLDSNERPELKDTDPANRLMASQSPRRLEAEFVHDNALAIAGLIDLDIGGPSAYPYQPGGYYTNIQFPNRDYYASTDERQYRRGVYTHWQRTFLHPMMANFDAPSREECCVVRSVANTPQQALTLLNAPIFVEAARALADRVMASSPAPDAERINRIFQRALGRNPKPKETASLTTFLASQREQFKSGASDAKKLVHIGLAPVTQTDELELAAWTEVCRVVLNLHECITRY